METTSLRLTPRAVSRVRAGIPWIFSNEIDGGLKAVQAGDVVDLHAPTGAFLARGLASPHELVAVRILSWNRREDVLHPAFLAGRLRQAAEVRALRYPGRRSLRLVHGEADGLPGLEVDRLGDALVVRLRYAGWASHTSLLEQALTEVFSPAGAWLAGRDGVAKPWFGEATPEVAVEVQGLQSVVRLDGAPYYFDQVDLHALVAPWCEGRRVLDAYAGSGAAARRALLAGATSAMMVEKDEASCELAVASADLDGLGDRLKVFCDEGKRALTSFVGMGERFGVLFLDPPTFARTRKDVKGALPGHTELHTLAMTLMEPGGILVTTLRGVHVPVADFERALAQAAHDSGRVARILHRVGASADHVESLALPEAQEVHSYVLHVGL